MACVSLSHPLIRDCLLLSALFSAPGSWQGTKRLPRSFQARGAPKATAPAAAPAIPGRSEPRFSAEAPIPPGSLGPGWALLSWRPPLLTASSPPQGGLAAELRLPHVLRAAPRGRPAACGAAGQEGGERGPVLRGEHPGPPGADSGGWGRRTSYSSPATPVPGTRPGPVHPRRENCKNSLGNQ